MSEARRKAGGRARAVGAVMASTAARGNCYAASEALYHLLGGRAAGWTPMQTRHEGDTHWFLRHASGLILDPTVSQFATTPDYTRARGRGFLTRQPSRRAAALMRSIVWQGEAQ